MGIFLIENKKCEKHTFFRSPPLNETFVKKHEKWPLASNRSTFKGPKNRELHTWMSMPKLIKNGRFWPFWSIRAWNGRKLTKKWVQKMSDIFFQYQDFSKSRYWRFFFKTRFCPCPFGRESRYWRKKMSRSRFYYS